MSYKTDGVIFSFDIHLFQVMSDTVCFSVQVTEDQKREIISFFKTNNPEAGKKNLVSVVLGPVKMTLANQDDEYFEIGFSNAFMWDWCCLVYIPFQSLANLVIGLEEDL